MNGLFHRAFHAYIWMASASLMVLAHRGVNGASVSVIVAAVFVAAAAMNVIAYCAEAAS